MKHVATALCMAVIVLGAHSASADVIYDFIETGATGFLGTLPPGSYAPQLTVTDAAYGSGALSFSQQCAFSAPSSCTTTGDMSGFVSLADTSPGFGDRTIDIAFNPDNTLTGSIFERGLNEDLDMSGEHFSWSGTLLSDRYPACGVASPCGVEGYWLNATAVPEPGSLPLMAVALTISGLLRMSGLSRPR